MVRCRACLLAAALLLAGWSAGRAAPVPIFLAFLNAPSGHAPLLVPPRLLLSVGGGGVIPAVMDTGSTGIVISAAAIPAEASLPGPPGFLEYSSSGRIERGRWVMTRATIRGANGRSVTTRPIRVLAVTRVDCIPHARHCRPVMMPRHIAMIGVGFGREGDHQPESTPARNPFLNLAGPVPPWRGYIVTRHGVTLGLDPGAKHGFAMVHLARSRRFPDWDQAPGCIVVADAPPACGVALIDTGVVAMYLSVPFIPPSDLAPGGRSLRAGTHLAIAMPDTGHPVAHYTITIAGPASPLDPVRIILVPDRRPFVNTTVRFLNGFDFLYNASVGLVGARPDRAN